MNIIDLFAGCGGMSKGFEDAGFKVLTAIEKDEWASETYKKNHLNTKVITEDITKLLNLDDLIIPDDTIIDGIVGGPPCQGFSLSGNRDKNDPRNSLFMEFVRFVKFYMPKFFVMENVTGILSMKTKNNVLVQDLILEEYKKAGYSVKICKLNAADYGVPQTRIRVFFIGIRNDIKFDESLIGPLPQLNRDNYVTIEDAIMDLPQINSGENGEGLKYNFKSKNSFQEYSRKNSNGIFNHIAMKHTKRLIERFENINCGQSVADVDECYKQRKRGDASKISGKTFAQNNMRPFLNRPSPTVPASFQSNFIHPVLNRNFTAREGARLQSFPDNYVFFGKRTTMSWEKNLSQYQQIGNAVPPLLANAIAKNINDYLSNH